MLGTASALRSTTILQRFYRSLAKDGLDVTLYATEVENEYLPHCHIRVGGDSTYCPLCQNRLPGPAEAAYFPATAPRIHRASLLYKIIAFLLSAVVVVAGAFDFLLLDETPHRHFSLLLAVWFLAALRVLRSVLRRRYNARADLQLLLLVSALLVFTDWFNGYTGYSLDLVVPILCCVALGCNFVFAFLRSRFTANALVYLLMNIGIGLLPYILLFLRLDGGKLDATASRGSSADPEHHHLPRSCHLPRQSAEK